MDLCKETKWLCENAGSLEKFAGQWVAFSAIEGVVSNHESLDKILKSPRHKNSKISPFVFHVPFKEDLASPLHVAAKK